MTELAPQQNHNYSEIDLHVSRFRFGRIPLNNAPSGQMIFQTTSSQLAEFKIASNTSCNINNSYITYNYQVPALAGSYSILFEKGLDFAKYAYFGDGSTPIVDYNNCDAIMSATQGLRSPLDEYLTNDPMNQIYPSNQLTTSNILPFSIDGLAGGTANASNVNYTEPQYLRISSAVNQIMNVYRHLPLSRFKDTFLGYNKTLVWGTDMYLRFLTNYVQRIYFYSTSNTSPNAGTVTQATQSLTVNNITLWLAIEMEEVIRSSLLNALASNRISLTVPYTYVYRLPVPAGSTTYNLTTTLTRQFGRAIRRIAVIPFAGGTNEFNNNAYNNSNVNGTKTSQIQTTMDGRPLTDFLLNVYNPNSGVNPPTGTGLVNPTIWAQAPNTWGDDYREMKSKLCDTYLQNYNTYLTNWMYCDFFGEMTALERTKTVPDTYQINSGFSVLDGDHIYTVLGQCPAITYNYNNASTATTMSDCFTGGLIVYIVVTYLRTLNIHPSGFSWSV